MIDPRDYMFPGLGSYGPSAPSMNTTLPTTSVPTIGGASGGFGGAAAGAGSGLGLNVGTANMALSGLNTIANIWGAFQAAKLAKRQFNFTKDITETNLANQIRSYNTALEDRARSRAVVEGQSSQQMQDYIDRNRAMRG